MNQNQNPNPNQNNSIFNGPFAAFGQTIDGLKDKISQIQAQRVINKDAIKQKLTELGKNIDELVQQTNAKLRPLASRNAELSQQVQQQQQQLQELQQQLQQLQQQIQQLQQQMQQLTQEKQQLQQNLEQAQQRLEQLPGLQQQVQELNQNIQQKDQQIAQVTQELNGVTDKITQVNGALASEIEKLNDLIGNRSNEEITNIISDLQSKLTNIINTFNNATVSGGTLVRKRENLKRNKKITNKRRNNKSKKSLKGGYVYQTSKDLERNSSVISESRSKSKNRRTKKRGSSTSTDTENNRSKSVTESNDSFFAK